MPTVVVVPDQRDEAKGQSRHSKHMTAEVRTKRCYGHLQLFGSLNQKPPYDTSREGMTARTIDNLAGTWKLVSASASTASGERGDSPFGPSPTGILTYAREGRIAVMVSYSGRKHSLPIRSWHPLKKEPRLSPHFSPMREGTHLL